MNETGQLADPGHGGHGPDHNLTAEDGLSPA